MTDDDKPKLHSTDEALIEAARTGKGTVPLTAKMLDSIKTNLDARRADIDTRYPELIAKCDYETKLAVTAWVIGNICDHAREGGTFRHLIYHRLGFGPDAYLPLYLAGGMDISNEFALSNNKETTGEDR